MGLKESGLRASVRSVSTVVPAFFDVAITNTNSPINEGDVLVVDYSVDNTGDSFETQDIRLEIDSVQEDADLDVSLSGGASDSGTLEWDTTGQGAATYEATVLSDDDSDTVTVEIPDAFFDVAIQSTNSPVEEGETLNVDYLVDNTGGVEDTQDIRLEIDNTQEDVDTGVTLDSGTSTTGTLQWDTTGEAETTYSATVLSDDDSDSVTVEIESAIPDSVTDQWDADEGSGTTVANSIGDVDINVVGGAWVSDSKYTGGFALDYDSDDYWELESPIDINGSELTVCFWTDEISPTDQFGRIITTTDDPSGRPEDGWELQFDGQNSDEYLFQHRTGGSSNNVINTSGPDAATQDLFWAITIDGDNARIRIYDTEEKVFDESGSGTRGTTNDSPMIGMRGDGNGSEGVWDSTFASQTDELSESEIEEIWEETNR